MTNPIRPAGTAVGRTLRYLREARDLAERSGNDWFAAGSRVQLGILDAVRGSLDGARPLLEEALDLSLAARSTSFVTLCLAGYAWLAFADGDPDRAALLEGAAEGLRRRVGLSAWPHLRRVGRAGGPGPPHAGRSPVRSGVLRRLRADPAAGGRHRPGPAWTAPLTRNVGAYTFTSTQPQNRTKRQHHLERRAPRAPEPEPEPGPLVRSAAPRTPRLPRRRTR
jgi:hypothetical protein